MIQTVTLVEEIATDLRPAEERLMRHPYLQAVEEGKVSREKLRIFAGEQYAIIGSDLRSVAHLVSRFGGSSSGDFFLRVLDGERAAATSLLALGRALDMDETALRAYEPLPGAHAYTCFMAWLALYGSDADVAAAYLTNFPAWGKSCARLSQSLVSGYGLRREDVGFFDLFASSPPGFREGALAVIEAGLARGEDPRAIHRAARLLQGYELLYWDTLYRHSIASAANGR